MKVEEITLRQLCSDVIQEKDDEKKDEIIYGTIFCLLGLLSKLDDVEDRLKKISQEFFEENGLL